jgi:hypothetical protein
VNNVCKPGGKTDFIRANISLLRTVVRSQVINLVAGVHNPELFLREGKIKIDRHTSQITSAGSLNHDLVELIDATG